VLDFIDIDGGNNSLSGGTVSAPLELSRRYLTGNAIGQVLAQETAGNGSEANVLWMLADQVGSNRDLAQYDTMGDTTSVVTHYTIDSYGNPSAVIGSLADTRYIWAQTQYDAIANQHYAMARWYDPRTGSWESEDPESFKAGDANLGRYVGNDPTNSIDPIGLKATPATIGGKIRRHFALTVERALYSLGTATHGFNKSLLVIDELGEMIHNKFIRNLMNAYYRTLGQRTQGVTNEWRRFEDSNAKVPGKWVFSRVSMYDTGFFLNGTHRVSVHLTYEARQIKPNLIEIRDIRANWTWHDEIDANSFEEFLGVQERTWNGFIWRLPIATAEGLWDLVGDGLLDTNFPIKVHWSHRELGSIRSYTR